MTPSEYLDAAKARLGVESDYELAKRLEAPRGNITEIRQGKRGVPVEMAFRLAITLELDPASVVADLESQREKNEKRRSFWAGFLQRAAAVAALACTLALSYSAISGNEGAALGGAAVVASATYFLRRVYAHNLYYVKSQSKALPKTAQAVPANRRIHEKLSRIDDASPRYPDSVTRGRRAGPLPNDSQARASGLFLWRRPDRPCEAARTSWPHGHANKRDEKMMPAARTHPSTRPLRFQSVLVINLARLRRAPPKTRRAQQPRTKFNPGRLMNKGSVRLNCSSCLQGTGSRHLS